MQIRSLIKDTRYLWGKNSKQMQLLDVLACNSANKDGLLAELQTRMSRSCWFLLFSPLKYQVSLMQTNYSDTYFASIN